MTRTRPVVGLTAMVLLTSGALLTGCSNESDSDVQARIQAVYQAPPNDVRADCLAAAIVRRAKDADVGPAALANTLAKTSSGTDPTLTQAQARVIADSLTECPLSPPVASTTTTSVTTPPTTPAG